MSTDLERIEASPHLLDLLIQMEDVLDSLDLYVFKNWFKGEIVEGPHVRRHWFDMTLRYDRADPPDPRGALLLRNHGVRVVVAGTPVATGPGGKVADAEVPDAGEDWRIALSIPRRLVDRTPSHGDTKAAASLRAETMEARNGQP